MSQFAIYNDTTFSVGDTLEVHQEVIEGEKKRIQLFEGVVIAIKNQGSGKSFTIRKIGANSIGVEKILPLMLPSIKKIVVKRKGAVRRAKLYFLRNRVGKAATKIKEKKVNHSSKISA